MMRIYVVFTRGIDDDSEFVGAFSSEQLADCFIENSVEDRWHLWHEFFEIDALVGKDFAEWCGRYDPKYGRQLP